MLYLRLFTRYERNRSDLQSLLRSLSSPGAFRLKPPSTTPLLPANLNPKPRFANLTVASTALPSDQPRSGRARSGRSKGNSGRSKRQ